jgi:hypothetical protein
MRRLRCIRCYRQIRVLRALGPQVLLSEDEFVVRQSIARRMKVAIWLRVTTFVGQNSVPATLQPLDAMTPSAVFGDDMPVIVQRNRFERAKRLLGVRRGRMDLTSARGTQFGSSEKIFHVFVTPLPVRTPPAAPRAKRVPKHNHRKIRMHAFCHAKSLSLASTSP